MTKVIKRNTAALLGTITLLAVTAGAMATPVIDGRFDPNEGYATGTTIGFTVEKTSLIPQDGKLWQYRDSTTGDVSLYFVQPVTLVDNSYGKNSIGWGKHVAPSGKNHNLKDLLGSDKAQFVFTDGLGNTVLDITVDYFSAVGGGYDCLGLDAGGDSAIEVGSAGDLLEWSSSLDYNFNVLGYVLKDDSPAADINYEGNTTHPGWLYEVAYEIKVAGSLFDENGFGGVTIPIVHDSPNKIGGNKVYPTPEPATMVLLAAGIPLFLRRRRRQTAS